ncbi:hypothetical protein HWI79_3289 [Cryptosporidium felis]|nr:hypothetical protein HWI79_3289 [Cryptosporidium felis]
MEDEYSSNLATDELIRHLNNIVKLERLDTLTPKKVREELEESMGLPFDSLKSRKYQINELLDSIISELRDNQDNSFSSGCEGNGVKGHIQTNSEEYSSNKETVINSDEHNPKSVEDKKSSKRTHISMSVEEFLEKSKALNLFINESETKLTISPRQFNTGSVGWYYGGKIPFPVGDDEVICQVSINCTVVGSKSWTQNSSKKRK